MVCEGRCKRAFHFQCLGMEKLPPKSWTCSDCTRGQIWCLVCNETGVMEEEVFKCKKPNCGRFYHVGCIDGDERVRKFKSQADKFICAQHMCSVCKERPGLKPDRENFFLQCVKCPTAHHLRCAVGKSVDVLTYRSMVCEAHAEEHGKPPLELGSVAHIKYPQKRARRSAAAMAAAAAAAGGGGGQAILGMDYDDDEEDDEEDDDSDYSGAPGTSKARRPRKSNMDVDSEEEGGGGATKKKRAPRKKAPPSNFVSKLIGPFSGEGFRLTFKAVADETNGGKKGAAAGACAGQSSNCPCGKTDASDGEHYIMCGKVCMCRCVDAEWPERGKRRKILWYVCMCAERLYACPVFLIFFWVFYAQCQIWFHLRCAGVEEKEAAQITNYYCNKCDEDEESYDPIVKIKYQRAKMVSSNPIINQIDASHW